MSKAIVKKGDFVEEVPIQQFVLYIHFKFPGKEEERQKMHFPVAEKPQHMKLTEIYEAVVGASHV